MINFTYRVVARTRLHTFCANKCENSLFATEKFRVQNHAQSTAPGANSVKVQLYAHIVVLQNV